MHIPSKTRHALWSYQRMALSKLQELCSTTDGEDNEANLCGLPDCLKRNGALSTYGALHSCQRVQELKVATFLEDELPCGALTLFVEPPASTSRLSVMSAVQNAFFSHAWRSTTLPPCHGGTVVLQQKNSCRKLMERTLASP